MAERVVVRLQDIDDAIFEGISSSRELRRAVNDFIDDTETMWKTVWEASGPHPYETGSYIEHIKKRKLTLGQRLFIKRTLRDGLPIGQVYNDSDIAHFVEYGTGVDKPGSKSPWGPNTPTKEFAPMRRTAAIMTNEVRKA